MISVLILTKNEEQDLPDCLKSLTWCDDIHIMDSLSDDRTAEIAKNSGVKITHRKFDGYASQRNAALRDISFKHPWVLLLDADERVPDSLVPLLQQQVAQAVEPMNAFRIRRRDFFGTTWLKHAQISPYYIRLIRLGKAFYHREINEVLKVEGTVGDIKGYFDHYPFSKGIGHWLNKHNSYSAMEAARWIEEQQCNEQFSLRKAAFNRDFNDRRYHQKGLFYKLPARPVIKWFYMVFWRRAFLDGMAGITYATLQAIYEYFIVLKIRESLDRNKIMKSAQKRLDVKSPRQQLS